MTVLRLDSTPVSAAVALLCDDALPQMPHPGLYNHITACLFLYHMLCSSECSCQTSSYRFGFANQCCSSSLTLSLVAMRCQVRMLTGDSVETAVAIAKQCGILSQDYILEDQLQSKGLAQAQLQLWKDERLKWCVEKKRSGLLHPAPSPRPSSTGQQAMTGAQFRSLVLRDDGSIDQVRPRQRNTPSSAVGNMSYSLSARMWMHAHITYSGCYF